MNGLGNRLSAASIAAAILLSGCQQHSIRPLDLGPPHASCSTECKTDCLPAIIPGKFDSEGEPMREWPIWQGDPNAPKTWNALADQVISQMKEIAKVCETARASCVSCMQGLEEAGVVCGITSECRP